MNNQTTEKDLDALLIRCGKQTAGRLEAAGDHEVDQMIAAMIREAEIVVVFWQVPLRLRLNLMVVKGAAPLRKIVTSEQAWETDRLLAICVNDEDTAQMLVARWGANESSDLH